MAKPERLLFGLIMSVLMVLAGAPALARTLTSQISQPATLPRIHPEYPVPNEPNMLFYIERSSNSNTVVYTARLDANGHIDAKSPVDVFWRWYNVDGHKKPLIFIERIMAYGVKSVSRPAPDGSLTFQVAALPERKIQLRMDAGNHPEAVMQIGGKPVKLVYIYLHVDDRGLLPDVPELDIFGTDLATGKPVHEHLIKH